MPVPFPISSTLPPSGTASSNGYAVYTGAGAVTWGADVGAYGANSDSYYGTNDQAGNVWEWNDAVIGSSRGLRGGSWSSLENYLRSSGRTTNDPPASTTTSGSASPVSLNRAHWS
jgi:formylglycine-generating enzyme required for sulfatase activity